MKIRLGVNDIVDFYVKFSDECGMYRLPVGTVAVTSVTVGEVIFVGTVVAGFVVVGEVIFVGTVVAGFVVVGEVIFVGTVVVGCAVVGEVLSVVICVTSPENMILKSNLDKNLPCLNNLLILLCNKHQSGLPVVFETVTETVETVAEEFAGVVVDVAVVVVVVRGLFVGLTFGSS